MRFFDPWNDLSALRREIDKAFDGVRIPIARNLFLPGRNPRNYPLVNIAETGDQILVEALAPGLDPEKIDITVLRNQLTITGEKRSFGPDVKKGNVHRNERAAGRFVRTFTLPTEVNEEDVKAEYKAGVLTLTLAKAEAVKPRRVVVNAA